MVCETERLLATRVTGDGWRVAVLGLARNTFGTTRGRMFFWTKWVRECSEVQKLSRCTSIGSSFYCGAYVLNYSFHFHRDTRQWFHILVICCFFKTFNQSRLTSMFTKISTYLLSIFTRRYPPEFCDDGDGVVVKIRSHLSLQMIRQRHLSR